MRYIILADGDKHRKFKRHIAIVNGEILLERTIRLLKENGIKDIFIKSSDETYEFEGATRIQPEKEYRYIKEDYWLDAFGTPNEPTTYIMGDVYFTENAIKTIVETQTNDITMFGTDIRYNPNFMKEWDEPFAFKVIDYEKFKKYISSVKKMYDKGLTNREPVSWELYRHLNGYDINEHYIGENYVAINDISCDVDDESDREKLNEIINNNTCV